MLTTRSSNCSMLTLALSVNNYTNSMKYFYLQEWVSDCCLMPAQQFFSYIMARRSYALMKWCKHISKTVRNKTNTLFGVNDCCLMPAQQLFSYIMARRSYALMKWCKHISKTVRNKTNTLFGVNDCCLMPAQQFFSYIMVRRSYLRWNDDNDVCLVPDQHAWLDLYSAKSVKQLSTGRTCCSIQIHYADSSQLLLNPAKLAEKQQILIL
jgi:hypothetical protein